MRVEGRDGEWQGARGRVRLIDSSRVREREREGDEARERVMNTILLQ